MEATLKVEKKKYDITKTLLDPKIWNEFYCDAKPEDAFHVRGRLAFKWGGIDQCDGEMILKLTWSQWTCEEEEERDFRIEDWEFEAEN